MDALMMKSCYVTGDVTESSETDGEQDFTNALKLYGELHNRCKSESLNILTETDQEELSLIFQTLDKLNQTTSVLQNNPSSQQRSEQSRWRIVRVAVIKAVEMCVGIIEFNFRLYNSLGTMDDGRCSAEESTTTSSSSVAGCNCLAPKDEHRLGVQLRGLELLIRLDHSLTRFRLFMSKQIVLMAMMAVIVTATHRRSWGLSLVHCANAGSRPYQKSEQSVPKVPSYLTDCEVCGTNLTVLPGNGGFHTGSFLEDIRSHPHLINMMCTCSKLLILLEYFLNYQNNTDFMAFAVVPPCPL
ncbi:hypothetical protein IFM53868_05825 [Aspergillus udagawae]|uniref:Uncharacterized protein n=1 Tax=Aspergillus udagawae TaxID=91492 RepID=A0ABQ1AWR4_9EURO|nr:hypothetical protein IFM53868_05825 [Aspergillus udagawae]